MDRDSKTRTGARAHGVERPRPLARRCSKAHRPWHSAGNHDGSSEHEGRWQTSLLGRPRLIPIVPPNWSLFSVSVEAAKKVASIEVAVAHEFERMSASATWRSL